VWHARGVEGGGGRELVVRGDERPAAVQDAHARGGQTLERPEARLDPLEALEDVEAAERDVAAREPGERLRRRQHGAEARVRGRDAVGDDGEGAHAGDGRGSRPRAEEEAARSSQVRRYLVTPVGGGGHYGPGQPLRRALHE